MGKNAKLKEKQKEVGQEEIQKEDISIALMISGTIVYLRALQGHSGRSLIDAFITGQFDNSAWILLTYLPYRMCV